MKITRWKFSKSDKVIGGRPRGSELRKEILAAIERMAPDDVLDLSFVGVQTLDFSAADEIVGGLLARVLSGQLGAKRFYASGLGESVRESIMAVLDLKRRHCLELLSGGAMAVLGRINPRHRETLEYVCRKGEVAVAEVASQFWTEPNLTAATNRLNFLADAGLILRQQESGGRRGSRYVYRSFASAAPKRRN